ncbi:unnamed protein product [Microthlaspi erraticum]|uniref:BED-type domain-containing protein n=1 Tax=Microthlaspi erraticum TaxID=1685480 RepID=A0A6D2KYP6_9BRAS|nr:unnamed protein product [Microthlaspi erraticum]
MSYDPDTETWRNIETPVEYESDYVPPSLDEVDDDMRSSQNSQPQNRKRKVISVEDSDDGDDDDVFETQREDFPERRVDGRANAPQKKKVVFGATVKSNSQQKKKMTFGARTKNGKGSSSQKKKKDFGVDKEDEIGMSSQPSRKKKKKGKASDKMPSSQSKNNTDKDERDESESDDEEGSDTEQQKESKKHSPVWEDFDTIIKKDGTQKAQCKHCNKEYVFHSHNTGTSSLKRHQQRCLITKSKNVANMLVTADAKLKARKIDQHVFREMVAKSIIQHDLPFSYVEYERVRAVWKYLNDDVQVISRNTAVADVIKYYENEKAALKRELRNLPGRISFTSDLWTAVTDEGYVCLTAHYIDRKWQLKNKILVFNALPPPHSGIKLAMHLLEMLKEWGIDKKVFSLTLDNATSNDCMQDILKSQLVLRDDLLCGGEFFHVRCSAHILNLIVQDGLKVIGSSLHKTRESIKYVTASESRDILFRRSCESARVEEKRE